MKHLPKFILALMLFACADLGAQNFENAVGGRLGTPLSASYKMFVNNSDAIEAYAGVRFWPTYSSIRIAGAYQIHNSFDLDAELAPLQWYYGVGASVAFFNVSNDFVGNTGVGLGISGYLGLQYVFDDVPLELTADWIPTINLGSTPLRSFGAGYGSLGVRYILNR